jgi:hypothetical protein
VHVASLYSGGVRGALAVRSGSVVEHDPGRAPHRGFGIDRSSSSALGSGTRCLLLRAPAPFWPRSAAHCARRQPGPAWPGSRRRTCFAARLALPSMLPSPARNPRGSFLHCPSSTAPTSRTIGQKGLRRPGTPRAYSRRRRVWDLGIRQATANIVGLE